MKNQLQGKAKPVGANVRQSCFLPSILSGDSMISNANCHSSHDSIIVPVSVVSISGGVTSSFLSFGYFPGLGLLEESV